MPALPASVKSILDQHKSTGKAHLQIHFPNVTVTELGSSPAKTACKPAPTLSISSSIAKSQATKYFAIYLDLDAPLPSLPLASPILHGMQADLTTEGEADAQGWIKLSSSTKPIAPWAPPNPPPFSSAHRYVFIVWEQPEGLTNETIREKLKLPEEVGIRPRVRWDEDGCEKKLGLGVVLGGNYMSVVA